MKTLRAALIGAADIAPEARDAAKKWNIPVLTADIGSLRERGLLFVLRAIPLHLAYFVTSGLAFAVGTVRRLTRRRA